MDNITPFDGFVLIFVLLAMLLAVQPKKAAMSVCLAVIAVTMFVNYSAGVGYLPVKAVFPLIANIELLAASGLFIGSSWLRKQDRQFFYIMGSFLVVSAVLNFTVAPGLITEAIYMAFGQSIAVLHVLTMLMYSDGFVDIIRNIRDSILRNSFSGFGLRQ